MKVGDYVRTKNGYIGKIYNINEFREPSMMYAIDIPKADDFIFMSGEEFKSSPNIIELFEEHDLVVIEYYSLRYKERVTRLFEVDYKDKEFMTIKNVYCGFMLRNYEFNDKDKKLKPIIKSIVTKERFEAVEYKVEE